MSGRSVAIPAAITTTNEGGEFLPKLIPYIAQWVAVLLMWPVAALAHSMWSQPAALPWATAALALTGCALTIATWRATLVRPSLQVHATVTTALAMAWLLAATIAGPARHPILDLWLLTGPALAVSWNVRRLVGKVQQRGDGQDNLTKAVRAVKGARQIEVGPNKVVAQLEAAPGHSADEIVQGRGKLAAALEVGANRVRVVPNPDNHARATVTVVPEDLLKTPPPWPGPTAPGKSIAEPITVGLYEDGVPAQFHFPGDPFTGRNATHLMILGMSGSGKSHGAKEVWAELLTRTDVCLMLADAAKGLQTIGDVAPHAHWVEPTLGGSQNMISCLMDVITARTNQLAAEGLDQWVKGCSLPYLVVWLEEAARAVRDSDEMIDIAQTARSAGVSLVLSLQRPSMTNIPVEVRQQFGAVWCFGVKDIKDALFVLGEDLVEQGADPSVWANKKPGYSYLDAPGIPEDRATTPLRTFARADAELVEWIQAGEQWRPNELDPVTAAAAGKPYRERTRFTRDEHGKTVAITTTKSTTATSAAAIDDEDDEDMGDELVVRPAADPFKRRITEAEDRDMTLPQNPEPDLEGVDLDAELPELEPGDEIEFPRTKPTPAEARALLAARLADIRASGAETVGPKDIGQEFFDTVRVRSWVSAALQKLALTGELLETDREGVYRFPMTDRDAA